MSDNTTLNAGWGGDQIATDDINGVKTQRVKITLGADGVNDGDVAGSNPMPVRIGDSANLDAFSRLRVSNPTTLFSVQCQYNNASLVMESGATGTGVTPAHSADTRMVALSCTAGTGTSFIQSYQYIPYQPLKSHLIAITGVLTAGVAGAVVDTFFGDLNNGIFYRQNGASGLQFIRRTKTSGSVVDNTVDQADWNMDTLDGSGPSGHTLNPANSHILIVDLQFLAMGRVRVGFDIGGCICYAHEFLNANILAVPYMQTAALPVGMLITATDTAATKTAYFKCAAVASEGGVNDDFAFEFSTPEAVVTAGSATRTHAISIRPKTTFNGITNREFFRLHSIDMLVTGNAHVKWELCIGQAISGGAWADVNATYSAFEANVTAAVSGDPALVISSGYVSSGAQVKGVVSHEVSSRYPITLDRAGAARAMGTLTLLVTGISGASGCRAILNFSETR